MNAKKNRSIRPQSGIKRFFLKGQFEIMGLAVIVILVTLGMLFALSTLTGPETSIQQTFEQKRLAGDFIKASLDTQAPSCAKATIRELFQDCAQSRAIECTNKLGAFQNSCAFLRETYDLLFKYTLKSYNQKYLFKVEGPCVGEAAKQLCGITQGNIGSPLSPQSCPGEREISTQPLPTRSGTITLTLEICG